MSIETGNFLLYTMMVGIIIMAAVFGYTDELARAKRGKNNMCTKEGCDNISKIGKDRCWRHKRFEDLD